MGMNLPAGRTINVIVILTCLAFLLTEFSGDSQMIAFMGGFIPLRISGPMVDSHGALPPLVPVILTPLSATLIHGGWLHLGLNMLMLIFCGRQVEAVLGRWPTVILYVVGAYAAAAAQWAAYPNGAEPMIGASGAISALMGTYALLYSQRNVKPIGPIPASVVRVLWLAAGWIVLQALIGFAMGADGTQVAVAAHVGGFLAGLLLTRPLLRWRFRHGPVGIPS